MRQAIMTYLSSIKLKFTAFLTITAVILMMPLNVFAISSSDLHAVQYDTTFYDATVTCSPSGPAGEGPLYGPFFPKVADVNDLSNRIKAYIQRRKPNSPLLTVMPDIMSLAQKYDVNPVLLTAISQMETQFGTVGNGPAPQNNIFNVRNGPNNSFGSYASPAASVEAFYVQISGHLYLGPPSNFTTIKQVMYRYAPPGDGNATDPYITAINAAMTDIFAGISTSVSPTTTTSPTTDPFQNMGCGGQGTPSAGCYKGPASNSLPRADKYPAKWGCTLNAPGGGNMTYYAQSQWGSWLAKCGCGPTSLAMIITTLTKHSVTPLEVKDVQDSFGGINACGTSSSPTVFPKVAEKYGLHAEFIGTNFAKAEDTIKNKHGFVTASMNAGEFTSGDHYIVLRGMTESNEYLVASALMGGHLADSLDNSYTEAFLKSQLDVNMGMTAIWP